MKPLLCIVVALAFVVMPVRPVAAEDFPIIFLLEPDKDLDGPAALAFVEGGYLDGLEVGMEGNLVRTKVYGDYPGMVDIDELKVEVHDVKAYASACVIRGIEWTDIPAHVAVRFETPDLGSSELRQHASEALAAKQYSKAGHYLEYLLWQDSLSVDSSVRQMLEVCRSEIANVESRKLTRKERKAEKKKAALHQLIGNHFFTSGNYDAAQYYLKRAVRADDKREHAKHLLALVDDGSVCDLPSISEPVPVDKFPEMIDQPRIEYPKVAMKRGVEGSMFVKALVDKSGVVVKAMVHKSSGSMSLDNAAVEHAYYCRYKPAEQSGNPIAVWVAYQYEFVLH